jgi:hypothetical protein
VRDFFIRSASCRARSISFFCPVQSTLQGAQHFFLIDRSLPLLGAQIIFFVRLLPLSSVCARIFLLCPVVSLVSALEFFI